MSLPRRRALSVSLGVRRALRREGVHAAIDAPMKTFSSRACPSSRPARAASTCAISRATLRLACAASPPTAKSAHPAPPRSSAAASPSNRQQSCPPSATGSSALARSRCSLPCRSPAAPVPRHPRCTSGAGASPAAQRPTPPHKPGSDSAAASKAAAPEYPQARTDRAPGALPARAPRSPRAPRAVAPRLRSTGTPPAAHRRSWASLRSRP
jgi:hypothetical protein